MLLFGSVTFHKGKCVTFYKGESRAGELANFYRLRLLTFFSSGSDSLFFSSGSGSKEPKHPAPTGSDSPALGESVIFKSNTFALIKHFPGPD